MPIPFKSLLNTLRGERIDQPDMQHAAESSQLRSLAQGLAAFVVGPDISGTTQTQRNYVVQGFNCTAAVLNLTIFGGVAILSGRVDGELVEGLIATKDDNTFSKTISLSNVPDGTYGVFVRFDLREDSYTNRAFWNADAVTPVEIARVIPTRLVESWSVSVELTAPGDEWMRIATVVKGGGSLTLDDERQFFFEGDADASPTPFLPDEEWPQGFDRSDVRGSVGLFGLRRFVRAIQTQIQYMIWGNTAPPAGESWWSDPVLGLVDMFALDGTRDITGNVLPNADNTLDIGAIGSTWRDLRLGRNAIVAGDITIGDDLVVGDDAQVVGALDVGVDLTVGADAIVTGDVDCATLDAVVRVEAPFMWAQDVAPFPLTNGGRVFNDTTVGCWMSVTTSGGVISDQQGVGGTATLVGVTTIRITFDLAFNSAAEYAATVSVDVSPDVIPAILSRTSTRFDVQFLDRATGTAIDITATGVVLNAIVVGRY